MRSVRKQVNKLDPEVFFLCCGDSTYSEIFFLP